MSMYAKVHLRFDDTANRARGDVLPDLLGPSAVDMIVLQEKHSS
jgi:hypothetical protein